MASVITLRRGQRRQKRPRWAVNRLVVGLRVMWKRILTALATYFPPDEPQPSPPLSKAAALREGALLSEYVDARSKSRVA